MLVSGVPLDIEGIKEKYNMEDYAWILIIVSIIIIWNIIQWIRRTILNSKKYLERKPKLDNLERSIEEHKSKVEKDREEWRIKVDNWNEKIKNDKANLEAESRKKLNEHSEQVRRDKDEIQKIAKQKSMGFPWLAEAYADYFALKDEKLEKYLKDKKHPAYTAAENVRIIKNQKRELLKENKIVRYKIKYFEKLFPWLSELIADDENEYIPVQIADDAENDDNEDRVKDYLTP